MRRIWLFFASAASGIADLVWDGTNTIWDGTNTLAVVSDGGDVLSDGTNTLWDGTNVQSPN